MRTWEIQKDYFVFIRNECACWVYDVRTSKRMWVIDDESCLAVSLSDNNNNNNDIRALSQLILNYAPSDMKTNFLKKVFPHFLPFVIVIIHKLEEKEEKILIETTLM